jgi:hypothetical protein
MVCEKYFLAWRMLLIPVDHHERVEDLPAYIDAVASLHDMSDFLCESLPFPNPVDAIRLALSFSLTCCVIYVKILNNSPFA